MNDFTIADLKAVLVANRYTAGKIYPTIDGWMIIGMQNMPAVGTVIYIPCKGGCVELSMVVPDCILAAFIPEATGNR